DFCPNSRPKTACPPDETLSCVLCCERSRQPPNIRVTRRRSVLNRPSSSRPVDQRRNVGRGARPPGLCALRAAPAAPLDPARLFRRECCYIGKLTLADRSSNLQRHVEVDGRSLHIRIKNSNIANESTNSQFLILNSWSRLQN